MGQCTNRKVSRGHQHCAIRDRQSEADQQEDKEEVSTGDLAKDDIKVTLRDVFMNSKTPCPGELGHRSLRLKRVCVHTARQVLVNNPLFPVPIDGVSHSLACRLAYPPLVGQAGCYPKENRLDLR